jgi:hypothetical protein
VRWPTCIYKPLRWIIRKTPRPQAAFAWTQIRDVLADHELPWAVDLMVRRAAQCNQDFWWRGQGGAGRRSRGSRARAGQNQLDESGAGKADAPKRCFGVPWQIWQLVSHVQSLPPRSRSLCS